MKATMKKLCPKGTEIQTLIFSKEVFNQKTAKDWANKHDFKYGKVDEKENTFRLRQETPTGFKKGTFRTIELRDGVQAVIGCPYKYADGGTTEELKGRLVRLNKMDDEYAVPANTIGVIDFVDGIGQIHIKWENGSSLALVPEIDDYEIFSDWRANSETKIKRIDANTIEQIIVSDYNTTKIIWDITPEKVVEKEMYVKSDTAWHKVSLDKYADGGGVGDKLVEEVKDYIKTDKVLLKKLDKKISENEYSKIQEIRSVNGKKIMTYVVNELNLKKGQVYEYIKDNGADRYYDVKYMAVYVFHANTFIEFSFFDSNLKNIAYERFYSGDIENLVELFNKNKLVLLNDYKYNEITEGVQKGMYVISAPQKELSKNEKMWESIQNKFGEVYFSEGVDGNQLVSDQVKAEEYKWQFDRYSNYASRLSWADAEDRFKKSLTAEELDSIEISYKKEEYADLEEHDTEKHHKQIFVKLKKIKYADGGGVGEFPTKGELTNKDNFLLKYEKKGSDYEFYVYKPITKEVSGYNQIKHSCINKDCPQKMSYRQFVNYLFAELYLDDKKYANGGGVGNEVYIEFLNKEKGFKKDVKHFKSYEEAVKWAKGNFEKFNPDMIKFKMADGGALESKINLLHKNTKTYEDLSKIKAQVVNDVDSDSVPEIDIDIVDSLKFEGKGTKISNSKDAYLIFNNLWDKDKIGVHESMNILFLNKGNNVIGYYKHSKGGIDGTVADVEMISALAVKSLAKAVVIAHNHPSGNLTPSNADIQVSKELRDALKLFKIILLDSIIITKDNYKSLADESLFADGGNIDSERRFSKIDFDKLSNSGQFSSSYNGNGMWVITKVGGGLHLGKFNLAKEYLFILGKNDLSNPLVKWLSENSYADGGGVGKGKDIGVFGEYGIWSVLNKVSLSESAKEKLLKDFTEAGYVDTSVLFGESPQFLPLKQKIFVTAKNIQEKVVCTYLQASLIAEAIHNIKEQQGIAPIEEIKVPEETTSFKLNMSVLKQNISNMLQEPSLIVSGAMTTPTNYVFNIIGDKKAVNRVSGRLRTMGFRVEKTGVAGNIELFVPKDRVGEFEKSTPIVKTPTPIETIVEIETPIETPIEIAKDIVTDEVESIKEAIEYLQMEADSGDEEAIEALSYLQDELKNLIESSKTDKMADGGEILIGGKADYMSLGDIAEMHKVSLDHILRQAQIGKKIELEHTSDYNKAIEIVKDHLYESPYYYTKLKKMEKSFDKSKFYGGGLTTEKYKNDFDYNLDSQSVSCFINCKNTGRTLILKRANSDFEGTWCLISGGMESNELPDETIKREIQEELGVKLDFSNLIYLDSNKNPQGTHHYYEMSVDEEFEPTLNQENQSYKWVNMGGFPSNTHPLLIKYLKSHIYA